MAFPRSFGDSNLRTSQTEERRRPEIPADTWVVGRHHSRSGVAIRWVSGLANPALRAGFAIGISSGRGDVSDRLKDRPLPFSCNAVRQEKHQRSIHGLIMGSEMLTNFLFFPAAKPFTHRHDWLLVHLFIPTQLPELLTQSSNAWSSHVFAT
jgi:hypothetical protein